MNSKGNVTWSDQISRLFQKRCVECHREGDIAPFSLTNYDEVAGWAETIAEVIEDNRMPPWHASPQHGEFANDRHLSNAEKQLVNQWVADGAPEGDPKNLPKPRTFLTGWQLPQEPELVINMRDEPFDVPAEGTVRYQYFQVDPGFTEDKWIKMAEVQPGNRAVVHHILVIVRPPEGFKRGGLERSEWLAGYVPGLRAKKYPRRAREAHPGGIEAGVPSPLHAQRQSAERSQPRGFDLRQAGRSEESHRDDEGRQPSLSHSAERRRPPRGSQHRQPAGRCGTVGDDAAHAPAGQIVPVRSRLSRRQAGNSLGCARV